MNKVLLSMFPKSRLVKFRANCLVYMLRTGDCGNIVMYKYCTDNVHDLKLSSD